jgi:SnoaL-like domain
MIESPALKVALAYHQAWVGQDFQTAMTHISDDIVCLTPSGRFEGAAAFRNFMEPFSQIVTRADLLAAFGDETTAVVVYDTDTVVVKDAPGAEYLTVQDGQITGMRIIFDRTPFEAARRVAGG